ncbi:hypothetical protein ACFE04_003548 [Oxalis oulophora]
MESTTTTTHDHPLPKTTHIVILSGQSNMAGRGGVIKDHHNHKHWDGIAPPECKPNSSILRLNAHLHWETAHEPLHRDIDTRKACGVGPGMVFANRIVKESGEPSVVGLVPCAVGGTAIKEWARGQHLYENMVKRVKKSTGGGSGGGDVTLLWYQGESDTLSKEDAEVYKEKMEELIRNVREDLGIPNLPFIQVAIASGDAPYIDIVREAQLELGITLPNVVCVDAKGLQLKEDNLHLTTEAQVKLGNILADAYFQHFANKI